MSVVMVCKTIVIPYRQMDHQCCLSTDYDAPLTEAGDYTDKYYAAKDLIARYSKVPNIYMPARPAESVKTAYPPIQATQHLTLENLLQQLV